MYVALYSLYILNCLLRTRLICQNSNKNVRKIIQMFWAVILPCVCYLHKFMFFLLLSRITGEDGKEVIIEIEKKLPRLYKVLKVCVHF